MTLKQYENYKPSGVEWLGEIPKHWEVKRVKDISQTQSGTTPTTNVNSYYENGTHNWIRTTDLNDGKLYEVEYKVTDLAINECRLKFLPIDTILVAMYGGFGTIGKNSILKKASTINQSVCAILPKAKYFNSDYFLYFLKYFRHDWKLFADGTRKDPNINQDAVKNLFFIYPTLSEQKEIAHYLDQKTTAIDRKIDLLEKKIDRYQALRKSLINETVCRGLDKSVKLKDSGIEWIGQVPEHWEVKRLKDLLRKNITDGPHETPEFINEGYPFISVDGIVEGELVFDDCRYISKEDFKRFSKKVKIEKDDLFIGKAASTGKIARVKVGFEFTVWSPIAVIKLSKKINPIFIEYFFKSEAVQHQIEDLCTHNTQKNIAMKDIPKIILAIPFIGEQIEIANYLELQTLKIDTIVNNIKKQIETLKELRKTLINDVVTGKIKIMNEGLPLSIKYFDSQKSKDE